MANNPAPSALSYQTLKVLGLGILVALIADLSHPASVLRHWEATARDVEMQPQIFVRPAADVAQAFLDDQVVLIDARDDAAFVARHVVGSIQAHPQSTRLIQQADEALLAARDVIVLMNADQVEDARLIAQQLVLYSGAATAGTVAGGFEALSKLELPWQEHSP